MSLFRPKHPVSAKIALYDSSTEHVLIMRYERNRVFYGLPGGHIERHETPDAAMLRELEEEAGVKLETYQRKDFFVTTPGANRLIVAYTGTLASDKNVSTPRPKEGVPVWMTRSELTQLKDISAAYKTFALQNWP